MVSGGGAGRGVTGKAPDAASSDNKAMFIVRSPGYVDRAGEMIDSMKDAQDRRRVARSVLGIALSVIAGCSPDRPAADNGSGALRVPAALLGSVPNSTTGDTVPVYNG